MMRDTSKQTLPVLLAYLIAGLFVFRPLLVDPGVWDYADSSFPLDPRSMDYLFESLKTVWWNRNFLGYDTTFQTINSASYILSWKALYAVFGDFSTTQYAWYVIISSVGCFSMYRLTLYLFGDPLAAFVAGVFYGLNPWVVERMLVVPIYQAYAFIPALLLSYARYLDTRDLRKIFAFAVCAFFIVPSLHYSFYSALIVTGYALYRLLSPERARNFAEFVLDNLKLIVATCLFLGFYSIPVAYSFLANHGGSAKEAMERFSTVNLAVFFYGQDLSVYNAFRLLGFHDTFYDSQPLWFVVASFALPVLVTLPLVIKNTGERAGKKIIYFLYALVCAGVLLASATRFMSVPAYKFLLLNIPVLKTLASLPDPHYHLFLLAFAYAPLVGFSTMLIRERFFAVSETRGKYAGMLPAVGVIVLVLAMAYPVLGWTGRRHAQMEYPEEYRLAADYLAGRSSGSRTLFWPPLHSIKHSWAPYFVSNLDKFFFNVDSFGNAILEATPGPSYDFMQRLKENVSDPASFIKMLRLANVRYIVVTDDIEDDPPYIQLEEDFVGEIKKTVGMAGLKPVRSFGGVLIYRLDDKLFTPEFFFSDAAPTRDASDASETAEYLKTEPGAGSWKVQSIKRINATRYEIEVSPGKAPAVFVFSQSFSPKWRARVMHGQTGSIRSALLSAVTEKGRGTELGGHFMANGYANGWVLDGSKDYTTEGRTAIIVEYFPQTVYEAGILLSFLSPLFFGIYIFLRAANGKKKD